MTSHTDHSLVQVRFTIFDVGAVVSDNWASEIDDQVLFLPPECVYVDDCLTQYSSREVYVLDSNLGTWQPKVEHEWRFTKWAIAFDFTAVGEAVSGDSYSAKTAIEREMYDMGSQYLFVPFLEALIDAADDLIDQAVKNKRGEGYPIYEVAFVTAWSIEYYQTGWEYVEWDMTWDFIGRVDIKELVHRTLIAEAMKV